MPSASTLAATAAYEEAGVGPDDLDVVECQDTDAARELLAYEELGLCKPGGAAGPARRGRHRARRPAAGQPERGTALQGRAARAPRGWARWSSWCASSGASAGPRQVDGARVALAHTVGRGANAGVTILVR